MLCKVESPQGTGCAHCEERPVSRFPWRWPAALLALAVVLVAASTLAWPTLAPTPLAAEPAAAELEAKILPATSPGVGQKELLAALVRYGARPEGLSSADFPGVDVLLATPFYFQFTGRQPPEVAPGRPSLVFYVSESVHAGQLPSLPPRPFLKVGGVYHDPAEANMLTDSPHHRTTMVRYKAAWSDGNSILTPETRSLEMVFPAASGGEIHGSVLSWELPVSYSPTYSSRQVVLEDGVQTNSVNVSDGHEDPWQESREAWDRFSYLTASPLTVAGIAALLGMLLVVLTPCLIDLSLYYGACLGGAGAVLGTGVGLARSHLVKSALFFTMGFALVYTTGGTLAGYSGQVLQGLGVTGDLSHPFKIAVGILIIFLALRVAAEARAPLACRLPLVRPRSLGASAGPWGSTLQGATFAARCFTCFSGAALSVLLLYAATSGSPATGALLLLSLSLGLGLVLVLSALSVNSFLPLVSGLRRWRPVFGLSSALVMAVFGATSILDIETEHIFSDLLFRLLGVG